MYRLLIILTILFAPIFVQAQTHFGEVILPTELGGADPACSNATADGDICVGDDAETIDDMFVGDDLTVTGLATIGETLGMTGDLTLSGGAGALTFSGSASSIVVDDNDATALLIGSSGALNLITLNTGTATESVIITGTTAVEALKVDVGTATFDETVLVSGDLTLSGDAGALTFDSGTSSIVITDNDATSLVIGSTGLLNLLTLDTADATETVIVTGTTTVEAFKVDAGNATFDEDVTISGGAGALKITAASSSIEVLDNSATGLIIGSTGHTNLLTLNTADDTESLVVTGETAVEAFTVDVGTSTFDEAVEFGGNLNILGSQDTVGWLDAAAGNAACSATCAGTGACLFGYDTDGGALVDCADTAADSCICGGPIS